MKYKKGSTMSIWLEVVLFSLLFVIALGIISSNMNSLFDKSIDLTGGLVTNSTLNDLKDAQKVLSESTEQGQSSFTSLGILTLTTLPKMIMLTLRLFFNFITGGWIDSLVGLMNLGEYASSIIIIFRILYFIMVIFILFKILTRVNP